MSTRLPLACCGLSAGKKARLHRILYKHGLGNGTALFLPYDQGLEHGPRDFFADPIAADPKYIVQLALEGGFNGIAIQIGLAEKFYWDYAGEVPLIHKLNGKTDIPSDVQVKVQLTTGQAGTFTIVGIYTQTPTVSDWLTGPTETTSFRTSDLEYGARPAHPRRVHLAVRAEIAALLTDSPEATVSDRSCFASQQTRSLNMLRAILQILMAMAIIIAVLGIVNTLALSVIERTHELGPLRAIGRRRRPARRHDRRGKRDHLVLRRTARCRRRHHLLRRSGDPGGPAQHARRHRVRVEVLPR